MCVCTGELLVLLRVEGGWRRDGSRRCDGGGDVVKG